MSKHLKWILSALILLTAGFAVLLSGCNSKKDASAGAAQQMRVYWNVERTTYEHDWASDSLRQRSDGYYRIRFAVDGEQVDLMTDMLDVATKVDNKHFMGLVFDDQGLIVDVVDVKEFTGGTAYVDYYVEAFTDTSLTVNCTANLRGPRVTYALDENTQIYNATGTGIMVGTPGKLSVGAKVSAVLGKDQVLSHVYVEDPFVKSPVYWNVTRMYDSTEKQTTRSTDAIGNYVFQFAVEGELVKLKTRDFEVACYVDSIASRCLHLELDDDGYIIGAFNSRTATGGSSIASWYHITELTDNTYTAKRFDGAEAGKTVSGYFAKDLQVFDVSGTGAYIGEPTQLQLYDRVHCLRNVGGDVCTVFVVSRFMDGDMYWNLEQKYNSSTKTTTRIPDEDGWYYLKMAVNGGNKVMKTKDIEIVNAIDARAARCCVLKAEGDVITAFGLPGTHFCGIGFCSWADVTAYEDGVVTAKKAQTGVVSTGVLSADCKIYDVSETAAVPGAETTLRVGDRIHALKDLNGEVGFIFVVSRPVYSDIYYNLNRKWDSVNKVTTRKPAEDGYYYVELLVKGEVITVKTKSYSIANSIDSGLTMGLSLSADNTVQRYYKITNVKGYTGGSFLSGGVVTKLSGKYVTATKSGKTEKAAMAWNCKVYDLSNKLAVGQATELRVGDSIHSLMNADGQLTAVYVLRRPVQSKIYWNMERRYDSANAVTKRTPAEDGFYYISFAVGGEQKTFKTDNIAVATAVDAYASKIMGLELQEDVIVGVYPTTSVEGYQGGVVASWYSVNSINGTTYEVEKKLTADKDYGTKLTVTIPDGTPVYNCSNNYESFLGEPSEIRVGDKIHCLKNKEGNVVYVTVVERLMSHELYWNVTRMYDSEAKVTTRTPDADGWYTIKMVGPDGLVELKTDSREIASTVDSRAGYVMALKLEGNVIKVVYPTAQVYRGAGGSLSDWGYRVTELGQDGTATLVRNDDVQKVRLTAESAVYDVSDAATFGDTVELKVGDELRGVFFDAAGNIGALFVYNHGKFAHCPICNQDVYYVAWGGKYGLSDGHYYLENDVTVSAKRTVAKGKTVTLDLNGHTVSGTSGLARILEIEGIFNLTDAKVDGKFKGNIIANAEGKLAPVFYVREGATFNLYGGNLTCTKVSSEAGVGTVFKATMNIYDGRLYDGSVNSNGGGNLGIFDASTVNMYGGIIEGGKSTTMGGNVYTNSAKSTFRMLGGTITGGEAATGGSGALLRGTVILGGNAKINGNVGDNLYLYNNQEITLASALSEHAVGVTMASGSGVFTQAVAEDAKAWFTSDDGYDLSYNADGKLELVSPLVYCGICKQNVLSLAWDGTAALTEGHYHLDKDVTVSTQMKIAKGKTVTLDLNGHTVSGTSTLNRVFDIEGIFNLTDAKVDGKFKGNVIANAEGKLAPVFYVREGATFNLYGGNLTCTKPSSEAGVGTVYKGTMNIYDGRLYGGQATSKGGGNLGIFDASTVNMYGGIIEGGKSTTMGGNVYTNSAKSTFRMLGGTITGGESATGGSGALLRGTVILGGDAKICGNVGDDMLLYNNQKLTIASDLTENAIGISMTNGTGVFTAAVAEAALSWFTAKTGYVVQRNAEGQLELIES